MKKQLLVLLFVFGCTSLYPAKKSELMLSPLNAKTVRQNVLLKSDSCDLTVEFNGVLYGQLEFDLQIKNNSTDTIQINPASFHYIPDFGNAGPNPVLVQSLVPEQVIHQLMQQKDTLSRKANPYSLSTKSVGTIIKEGLVTGTVAQLFGQKMEAVEKQRQEDEYDWNTNRDNSIGDINTQLQFWQNKALKQMTLLPNMAMSGKILFPIEKKASEMVLEMPIKCSIATIKYQQYFLIK